MNITSRFQLIFWGALFALFDLNFNGFDILPDVIGYLLLVIGCGGLACESRGFSAACWLSGGLGIFSCLPDWLLADYSLENGRVLQFFQGVLICFLLGGIKDFASASGGGDLANRASRLRIAYVVLILMVEGCAWSGMGVAGEFAVVLMVGGVILIVFILFLILQLIGRVRREIAANPNENRVTRGSGAVTGLVSLLLVAMVAGVLVHQNSGYRSSLFSGANFHGQNPQECAAVEAGLRDLLRTKGFSLDYAPTEMDRFAGFHSEGEHQIWLKSDQEEFKGIYLNVATRDRSVSVSTKWEHAGVARGANRTERKALELSLELARWLGNRPEKDDSPDQVRDSGIRYFEEALAKLPK